VRFRYHGHRFPIALLHHFHAVGGFHWSAFLTAAGAIATAAGVAGGAIVAFFYGRKANALVSGVVHKTPSSGVLVLAARPSIQAVGFRGLKVAGDDDWASASVQVTEVWLTGGRLDDGFQWEAEKIFGTDEVVVSGGETLTTTVLIELGQPPPRAVIGWRVAFFGTARRTLGIGGWAWEDKTFVPAPDR